MKLNSILNRLFKNPKFRDKFFYPLLKDPFNKQDLIEGIKVILSKQITMSHKTLEFEKIFRKKIKVKNSLMVNSGSSANLLSMQCLINPYRKKRLKQGDEVLIPALCWSTSLWPIVQSGLKPVFVDINISDLNINLNDLEKKITKKTRAIMLVHVLSNSTDMDKLLKLKKKYDLIIIEDTCESLGTKYKKKYLGTFGDFSTFSFYYSHQITSGEGGMVCCKDRADYEIIRSLRSHGWSRGLRNEKRIAKTFKKLDPKFIFYNSGFNLRPTDISAAIGCNQFKRLDKFTAIRSYNRSKIINSIKKDSRWNNQITFIESRKHIKSSWFGLPFYLNIKSQLYKSNFIKRLEKLGIETRPIISGSFTNQPSAKKYKLIKRNQIFRNADFINNHGLFVGLHTEKISNKILKQFKNSIYTALNYKKSS